MMWWVSLADGASRKVCARMQRRKSWFEGRLDETLFEERIVGCAPKALQCPT